MILIPKSRRVLSDIRLLAVCLLTLFGTIPTTEAAPTFEPVQAFELSPKKPQAKLIQGSDGDFYGTSSSGGINGLGTVFKMTPGGALTTLVHFAGPNGSTPLAGLITGSDGNFYGTTSGGDSSYGTVFRMTPDGVLTTVASFTGTNGSNPRAGLILGQDGNFYGTTSTGHGVSKGTVFKMTADGTLTTLANFVGPNGSSPEASLLQGSDGNFYGTTRTGGSGNGIPDGYGTIFRLTPGGILTTLVNFMSTNGRSPTSGLIQGNDGNFYGTTDYGGSEGSGAGYGTVFKMTPDGMLTTLVNFTDNSGIWPQAGLVQGNDGNFYGTTSYGSTKGLSGSGTAFKMTPDGTFFPLTSFKRPSGGSPQAAMIQGLDGNLYGTTFQGGGDAGGDGTIFKMTTEGTLTTLVYLADTNGKKPEGKLVQGTDGNLYGTTHRGGSSSFGTVFKMTHDGVLTTLVNFDQVNGRFPEAGVIQGTDGNFYGTTAEGGGDYNDGTVFKVTPDGTLTTLVRFSRTNGSNPRGRLIQGNDGNFYGTTDQGGSNNKGTVFKMTPGGTLTTLVNFAGANGSSPVAGLVQAGDGNFYGTTLSGGSNDLGTVFRMTPGGTLTKLVNFTGPNGSSPYAELIQASDGNLYGTTHKGGSSSVPNGSYGLGTVFKTTPDGNLTTLANFAEVSFGLPYAGVIEGNDGNFYGTTPGLAHAGTYGKVFQMTPGGILTTMVDFSGPNGNNPQFAALAQGSDGNLYGTTTAGGTTPDGRPAGGGQIFRLRMDPVPTPEITIESPSATALTSGTAFVSFGPITKTSSAFRTFNIGNIGTADLTGVVISVDGANAADFSITSSPATQVPGPTGITTFTVQFSPQSAGVRTAALHIVSNDSDESPFDIVITGTGVWPTPEISVAQPLGRNLVDGVAKKSFGTVKVGKTGTTKIFTIKNTGTAALTGLSISKSGPDKSDFAVSAPAKVKLAPGASTSFKVNFSPKAKGSRSAAIHLKSNDKDESPFDIKISGFGAKP